MEKINKSKSSLKGKITRLEKFIESVDDDTKIIELKVKLKSIESFRKKVDELRDECFEVKEISSAELKAIENDLDQCEDRLEEMEVRIETLIDSYKKPSSTTRVVDSSENDNFEIKTKIPPLSLPVFTGKYEEFSAFKIQFDELITNNNQLTQSQKLYYLRSCLKDEAKNLASNFDNFESLYEALQSRYDNQRLIVDIHIQNILNFEKIQNENAKDIRAMIDCVQKNLRALSVLKYERNNLSDVLLINILILKLDKDSRKNFELSIKTKNVPTFDEFIKFLEQRESVLLSISRNCSTVNKISQNQNANKSKALIINENKKEKSCILCKQNNPSHPLYLCDKFRKLNIDERMQLIRNHKLCEICLLQNHKKAFCRSSYKCSCGLRHSKFICRKSESKINDNNRLQSQIHKPAYESKNSGNEKEIKCAESVPNSPLVMSNVSRERKSIILSTAAIYLQNSKGARIMTRCLLDSASNICCLTETLSNHLGIKKERIKTPISGLNGITQSIKWKLNTTISNEDCSFKAPAEFLIVDKITGKTPSVSLDVTEFEIPDFLNLADKSFHEASEVHALISADIFFKILKGNVYKINEELWFRESEFGWIAGGRLKEIEHSNQNFCFLSRDPVSLQDTMRLFFDLEGLGIRDDPVIQEKDQAIEIFNETVEFKNGRYVVQLPFRKPWGELADNYSVAKQRFNNLWKRLNHDPELYQQYCEIIKDYLQQGIIELVEFENIENELDRPVYYLPHQAVKKEGRLTSKTRIVFDAGSHQNKELSLNDCLYTGPNLNPNLLDILINFRLNKIAFCSDIKQAFLQICLSDQHKDAVRFLWSNDEPCLDRKPNVQVYRFNRVSFGVSASPFLLAATIRHHLEQFKNKYEETVQLLDSSFYVDDLISGSDEFEEALEISRRAKIIMDAAGMDLRKWISNDENLMEQWKVEKFDIYPVEENALLGSNQIKVLGITWNYREDYLTIDSRNLIEFVSSGKMTKRFVLQVMGKLYDPLGLISPYIVRVKCLIQKLWSEKIPWDENLPPDIAKEWSLWCSEIALLENLKIPRLALDSDSKEDIVEIHSFCDASKKAYGAAIYLKFRKGNKIFVRLLTSKSRVAPLKGVTLPRLELLGALVAARLTSKVKEIVNVKRPSIEYHWTDSKITLFWIKGSQNRWKNFVANRVKEIKTLTNPDAWYHCSGKLNPSDILSRGAGMETLLCNSMWWCGPQFLYSDVSLEIEKEIPMPEEDCLLELKKDQTFNKNFTLTLNEKCPFFDNLLNCSNKFLIILRIFSFLLRFIHNCRNPERKYEGVLSSEEMQKAENILIKNVQREYFTSEISLLKAGNIPKSSKILCLSPFLDTQDLIRVGGRLTNSQLPFCSKHPILLPPRHRLTSLIITHYHEKYLHTGAQSLLYFIRQKYWPLNGRDNCKKIVHNCIKCFKVKPVVNNQKMGNLPPERVNRDFIFNSVGLDLCGPFTIKNKIPRKSPCLKVYVGVFICLATKAIHLDIISDLTSEAIIAAIKRFIARRGKCRQIFSDNATNFTGANKELQVLYKMFNQSEGPLVNYLAGESIKWKFIPPKSPNHGGLWERGVKAFKYYFRRTVGNSNFSFEEFLTIVTEIEGMLNSRPLTPLSSEVDDLEVLTPAHFLIGRPITTIVEPSLLDVRENTLSKWQRATKAVHTVWKRWSLSYLNNLQQRSKWKVSKPNIKIGDLVLVKEDNLPCCKWIMGRIVQVYPGNDGKIRVADVKMPTGIFKRGISKLCVLPIET